jgi:cation/acetate symporter
MVCGLASARVDRRAAVAGMLTGLTVTLGYMVVNAQAFRHFWALTPAGGLWWGVQPISAGIFGVPAGFAAIAIWALWRPATPAKPAP